MRKWLNAYFGFSRNEFNGLMALTVVIVLVMVFPYAYGLLKTEAPVTEAEKLAVMKLALADQQKVSKLAIHKRIRRSPGKKTADPFIFDPNAIDQPGWEELGLSAKQAQAILRYRKKGGNFKRPEDLKKMYTISESMYARLAPYVRIAANDTHNDAFKSKIYPKQAYAKAVPVIIEINGADTTELDKIKGIGMTFANRIVKYRERVGGFYKKEQLMEVFGLDSVKYLEIKDQVRIDASRLKKININTASAEDFKGHPYLRYKQVNALIQYRKQHGNYSNIADLNKVAILNQETINRLAAYLEF